MNHERYVLIPLLVDDPLRVIVIALYATLTYLVLIPLLVDDPLRGRINGLLLQPAKRLNPSFSG